jgi:type I restriction-modification system DNA methylase subunit
LPTKATSRTNMNNAATKDTGVDLGFEAVLWAAADSLRNSMESTEHKHAVLGLIFSKYISEDPEAKNADLGAKKRNGADRQGQSVLSEARLRETPLPKLNCSELEMVRTTDLMEGVA